MTEAAENGPPGACLVCSGPLLPARIPGLMRCATCGFMTANMTVTDEELKKLYGSGYFNGEEYFDYEGEAESLRLNFRRRISVLKKLMPNLAEAALFEIGAAYGYFLQEVGPHVGKARGIDISADAVAQAVSKQRVEVRVADYLRFELGDPVDVIVLWDTIEHLRRPDLFVRKAAQDLKPGGLLAITTGDIDSLNARIRGASWRLIHPPTHLSYFSVSTLSRLLRANGFEVAHFSRPGHTRKLRSVLHFITAVKGDKPALWKSLQWLPLLDLSVTVNLFDIIFMVGRRRDDAGCAAP